MAVWAENLHGHESADGLLVLDGTPPLVLNPWRDNNGPTLRFSDRAVVVDVQPLSEICSTGGDSVRDVDPSDGVVQWCLEGEGGIRVYANAFEAERKEFLADLVAGLEVRAVRTSG